MDHVAAAVWNFFWFLFQIVEVGGLGLAYFLGPLVILSQS